MNKKKYLVVAASLLLLGAVAVKPAMAYFTDTHSAVGQAGFGHYEITPDEKVSGTTKTITVKNTGDYPVFVRVKLFAGSTHGLNFKESASANWSLGSRDEFYYFSKSIEPGESTGELVVDIDANGESQDEFNVIVVSEACKLSADNKPTWDETTEETEVIKASIERKVNTVSGSQAQADATEVTENEGGADNEN